MFRSFVILILSIFCLVNADVNVDIGIKGGVAVSTLWFDGLCIDENNNKYSYDFGMFYDFKLYRNFSLQFETLGINKGYKDKFENIDVDLCYFDLSCLVQYSIHEVFNPYYGVSLDYLVSAEYYHSEILVDEVIDDYRILNDKCNKFDFNICLGNEFVFNKFVLDLRYSVGFVPVFKNLEKNWNQVKNECFSVTIGYNFLSL